MVNSEDWSAFTLGDLRDALETGVIATLQGGMAQNRNMVDYWISECSGKIDYILYIVGKYSFSPFLEPSGSVAECVARWEANKLNTLLRYQKISKKVAF